MTPLSKEHRPFWLKRISSLFGVVPLAIFVVAHLWRNARAMQGQRAYDRGSGASDGSSALFVIGFGLVIAPLAFHAVYGVQRTLRSRLNVGTYPLAKNWRYTLERVTGVVLLVFLLVHVAQFPLRVLLGTMTPDDYFPELCNRLSSTARGGVPLQALFYLVGIGATAYHVAIGLPSFCFAWGLLRTPRSERALSVAAGALGAVLFLLGADTVLYFATGSGTVSARETSRSGAAYVAPEN